MFIVTFRRSFLASSLDTFLNQCLSCSALWIVFTRRANQMVERPEPHSNTVDFAVKCCSIISMECFVSHGESLWLNSKHDLSTRSQIYWMLQWLFHGNKLSNIFAPRRLWSIELVACFTIYLFNRAQLITSFRLSVRRMRLVGNSPFSESKDVSERKGLSPIWTLFLPCPALLILPTLS